MRPVVSSCESDPEQSWASPGPTCSGHLAAGVNSDDGNSRLLMQCLWSKYGSDGPVCDKVAGLCRTTRTSMEICCSVFLRGNQSRREDVTPGFSFSK